MFPSISYLDWWEGRPEAALYDLGSSDLRGDRGFQPSVMPEAVADLPDPPAGVTLKTLLATEYGVEPECVLVTSGASHANFLAMATALDGESGDRVLVEKPGYEPLRRTPEAFGATVDRVLRVDDGGLDPERVEAALTDQTALVVVTNRHNPSGRLTDRETLAAVADVAQSVGARVLVDEVYAPYVTAEATTDGSFGGVSGAGLDGVVVTGSLTKFHGLGDVRIGWLVADAEFVDAARRVERHVPTVAGTSVAMGARVVYGAETLAARSRPMVEANSELLAAFVDARPDLSGQVPDGSTFAFLEHDVADGDSIAEAAWEDGILVVPGRFFDEPSRVRVSLGRTPRDGEVALERLGTTLDRLA